MFKNIFQVQKNQNTSNIIYENANFCFEHTLLDIEYILEDTYFDINRDHMTAVHIGIKSNNSNILQEGFNDFINSAVEFFKKMIAKFTDFMKRVFMYLNAYIGDFEKFIKRHHKALSVKYPDFTIQGYKFTIDNNLPNTSLIDEMISEYNSEISNVSSMTKAEIVKKRTDTMGVKNMNKIRGQLLNISENIEKDDFSDKVKNIFRDGDSTTDMITVNHDLLNDILNNYSNLVKQFKDAKKQKDKMISLLENIKSFFEKSASLQYIEGKKSIVANNIEVNSNKNSISKSGSSTVDHSPDTLVLYNTYFNFKFAYAKELSSMCVTIMSEKVSAMKEELKQCKDIVRRCISATVSGGDE